MKARSLLHVIICISCLVLPISLSAVAQQPPAPPVTAAGVPAPDQMSPQSPQGETPYAPSEPPTGYTSQPPPTVSVTGGVNVPVEGDVLKIDSDGPWRVDFEKGEASVVTARDHVRVIYQEFQVTSDSASADLRTRVATFTGNVILTIKNGQEVHGSELTINLKTREWSFTSAKSELRPELFPQQLRAPVFVSGESITGMADRMIDVRKGGFTTCNLDHPHYFISSNNVTVWTDRKLIAKDDRFYALGRTILRIARIVVPIRQVQQRSLLMPQVGQTAEEGFFLKTAYAVAASKLNTGTLKLDLMSKKGIGWGYDDNYSLRSSTGLGSLHLYQLTDKNRSVNSLTGRLTHQQKMGKLTANLTSDYRASSYLYFPGSTSLSNQVRLSLPGKDSSSSLGIQQSMSRGFGSYTRLASTLQHSRRFGQDSSANISFDYFRSVSPLTTTSGTVNAASAQLVSRLDYQHRSERFDWNLRVNKINDLSSEAFVSQLGTRFAGTERLPELELSTDSTRLKRRLLFGVPTQLDLAVGEYREDLGRVDTQRAVVGVNVPSTVINLSKKLSLSAGGGFEQYMYGDSTAQYSIDFNSSLSHRLGRRSSAIVDYRVMRPRGFSPFRFDFLGKSNVATARIDVQESQKLKWSLYTGYDFGQTGFNWQDLNARISYSPSDRYLLYTSTGYDLNLHRWRALTNQLRVRLPGDFKLDLGTRYEIESHKFSTIRTQIDTPFREMWHIRANAGYNGFTRDFDYRNIELVRDLHCWEMSIAFVDQKGSWQQKGIQLNFRIKAFPVFDTFGVGQFGQALDTSVGEVL